MRIGFFSLLMIGLTCLTGCTLQFSLPESSGGSLPPAIASAAESTRSIQISSDPTPTEQAVVESSKEVVDCPGSIELPVGIDPRACGPIPDDASNGGRGERFIMPSGNIACLMTEEDVTCQALNTVMIADFDNPEGDGQCDGFWLGNAASYLCHSAGGPWFEESDPSDWPELSYGESVFVFQYVCASENEGLTCWNSESGHGFFLSRSRYTHW